MFREPKHFPAPEERCTAYDGCYYFTRSVKYFLDLPLIQSIGTKRSQDLGSDFISEREPGRTIIFSVTLHSRRESVRMILCRTVSYGQPHLRLCPTDNRIMFSSIGRCPEIFESKCIHNAETLVFTQL